MSVKTKTAVVVFSDPKGGEEALGRLLNALFIVIDSKQRGQTAELIFQGAGVRWLGEIVKKDHPAYALYQKVKDDVVLACGGCADAFGAADAVNNSGVKVSREVQIPGTTGVLSLSRYLSEGYNLVTL